MDVDSGIARKLPVLDEEQEIEDIYNSTEISNYINDIKYFCRASTCDLHFLFKVRNMGVILNDSM